MPGAQAAISDSRKKFGAKIELISSVRTSRSLFFRLLLQGVRQLFALIIGSFLIAQLLSLVLFQKPLDLSSQRFDTGAAWITGFGALVVSCLYVFVARSRAAGASRQYLSLKDDPPFVLFLRSFKQDLGGGWLFGSPLGTSDLEANLVAIAENHGKVVIAIDNTGEPGISGGAVRLRADSNIWEEVVHELARCASGIIVDATRLTPGLKLEIETIGKRSTEYPDALILLGAKAEHLSTLLDAPLPIKSKGLAAYAFHNGRIVEKRAARQLDLIDGFFSRLSGQAPIQNKD